MLYYILFWTLMGFIIHFYIIFGTNLLTGGPTQIAVFFAYFSLSRKRNIKRSPNGMKPSGKLFLNGSNPGDLECTSGNQRGGHEAGGAPTPRARPPTSWAPRGPPDVLLPPIYLHIT